MPKKRPIQRGSKESAIDPGDSSRLQHIEVRVQAGGAERADRYVAERLGILSRSQLKTRGAEIEVNGRPAKLSRPLVEGDLLVLTWSEDSSDTVEAENIALSVLYEDSRVIVIDKAQGMVTHPGAGNRRGTLANALLWRIAEESKRPDHDDLASSPPLRGGIVHRLDKDTSGVIIAAKDGPAQAYLAEQFKARTTRKEYLAVIHGLAGIDSSDETSRVAWHRIENRLGRDPRERKRYAVVAQGGKSAVTDWRVLARYGEYAFVLLRPKTGRTHQLRVHMASLGSPIVGDPIYGRRRNSERGLVPGSETSLMLHAWRLTIRLPDSAEVMRFVAPLPSRFRSLLRVLERRFGSRDQG